MQETWIQSLGREDPLEKGMATHSSLENSMDRGAWQATGHGVIGLDTTEQLSHARKWLFKKAYFNTFSVIFRIISSNQRYDIKLFGN